MEDFAFSRADVAVQPMAALPNQTSREASVYSAHYPPSLGLLDGHSSIPSIFARLRCIIVSIKLKLSSQQRCASDCFH